MNVLKSVQQADAVRTQAQTNYSFASIGAVYADGVSLVFPGETVASKKHYPCAAGATFTAGQRAYITKASGTYVAVCPILGGS